MATFAHSTYDTSSYSTFRPTYGHRLLFIIESYSRGGAHPTTNASGQKRVALDLGCGSGQVTKMLAESFDEVIGADASSGMIEQARNDAADETKWDPTLAAKVKFVVSRAEDIHTHVQPNSVDLVTAGQAAHWFDQTLIWLAMEKVLKPGGTVAFWSYASFFIVGHPELTSMIAEFSLGDDSLGPFWQQPGTSIIHSRLRDIAFPKSSNWNSAQATRIDFQGPHHLSDEGEIRHLELSELEATLASGAESLVGEVTTDVLLRKKLTWDGMKAYFRTWSAYHSYQEKYPEQTGPGKDGDIVDQFVDGLKEKLSECENGVEVDWPIYSMMIRKAI
ncbi:hypothetical protein FRB93_002591 [Tulasnella sp. JGI-2019a]|nr:hypothetical protein FRB93_002591 [Tulasnella sp. JGI-2019a]